MQDQAFSSLATPRLLDLGPGSWQDDVSKDGRPYFVYTPVSYRVGTVVPLVVLLHGCSQSPIGIAYDTHMNQLAEQYNFIVIYPQHLDLTRPDPNPILCWNWFFAVNQRRGSGEPASLAGIVQTIVQNTSQWTIDQERIYVAGLSAGAGMAVSLGATYPDLFAAIGVHSGAEYQAISLPLPLSQPAPVGKKARTHITVEPPSDAQVLFREGFLSVIPPGPDPNEQGEKAFKAMGSFARVVPTIVFHGTADPVADPIGGNQVAQQWLRTNQLASYGAFTAAYESPSSVRLGQAPVPGGRSYTVFNWKDAVGNDVVVYWKVDGMGHAWSGGSPGSPFTDPKGPDASEAMYEFFMAHSLS